MKQWEWSNLKHAITSAPSLIFPSDDGHFHLKCNVSGYTTGAVLLQLQKDGQYHPVGFMSRGFNDVERNYQIFNKELLAHLKSGGISSKALLIRLKSLRITKTSLISALLKNSIGGKRIGRYISHDLTTPYSISQAP